MPHSRRPSSKLAATSALLGQPPTIEARLEGFDKYMAQVLVDWNVPGIGVGIVVSLGTGGGAAATIWTCDLSAEYVRINGEYRT